MGLDQIERLPFFSNLSGEEREFLKGNRKTLEFQGRYLIYTPTAGSLGLVQVLSGGVRAYLVSEEGKKAAIFRLHTGECSPCPAP